MQSRNPSLLVALVLAAPTFSANAVTRDQLATLERDRVRKQADAFLSQQPIPLTRFKATRSAGGPHDYFSEGDYWWPDPNNPAGPYVQRDGMSNPDNFNAHRHALIRMSIQTASLAAAHTLTRDPKYADHALKHWRAWFVDDDTKMNPHLQYAQAIHGRTTGRGIGIIDTLHLVEVAKAIQVLEEQGAIKSTDLAPIKTWFAEYLTWMTTSKHGLDEMNAENNHGTCWVAQVAAFASLTGDREKLAMCRERYKTLLLPNQMAADGSFPRELKRTKPYGYALFNLDAMAAVCQLASTPDDDLYTYTLPDGRTFRKAVDYMVPYVRDKSKWPLKPDVMFWEFWPVRHPSLLFASVAYDDPNYFTLWQSLEPNPTNEEVLRNWPIRQPLLWVD
jgi:hypothetical protein